MALPISPSGDELVDIQDATIRAALRSEASEEDRAAFVERVRVSEEAAAAIGRSRHRLLSVGPVERQEEGKDRPVAPSGRWRARFFDYDNNRLINVEADYPAGGRPVVWPSREAPLPSQEEWQAAVDLVAGDDRFGPLLERGELSTFHPMPPLGTMEEATGEVERTLHVGLQPLGRGGERTQIVAVNLIRDLVIPYGDEGPPGTSPADPGCDAPPQVSCQLLTSGPPGECWISWPASSPVWTFLVTRPSASSGASGSGVELRYVDYQGKRVLYQAHVPILNVQYDGNACGPYRDWLNSEVCFDATGTDIAPGFRWCPTPPQTICETGHDGGNFNGVAICEADGELVLTSVMQAGWYRYIQEWRFSPFGIIRPRLKFAATGTYCVCKAHTHHAYWRFDFDITAALPNLVEEFNDPPIIPGTNWHKKTYEIKRYRDYGRRRKWRVSNTASGDAYHIIPSPEDGVADTFGRGDLWVLRYHGSSEIDDSSVWAGDEANLDAFVNGELVEGQDVVVWYGAHFRHDMVHAGAECHEVGPDLVPAACVVEDTARGTHLEAQLDELRRLRDVELRASTRGSRLVELLEANDPELVAMLQRDEALRSDVTEILSEVVEIALSRHEPEPRVFDDALIARAAALLARVSEGGSKRLRESARIARAELPHFRGRSLLEALRD